jgi:hypothetical protein
MKTARKTSPLRVLSHCVKIFPILKSGTRKRKRIARGIISLKQRETIVIIIAK